jgi:fermentation-respiration switch protein FrsA (DUF1100 family)
MYADRCLGTRKSEPPILASRGSDGLVRLGPIGLAWITTRKQAHGSRAEACCGVRSSILSRLSNPFAYSVAAQDHRGRSPASRAIISVRSIPAGLDGTQSFRFWFCETLDAVWLIACGPPCAALLYLHGNATNLNDRMPLIQALSALGFSVLAIDWRGFGNSTGTPSQAGCQLDAEAALQWLAHRADLSKTVVLAESLGAGVAVELVAKHLVGALVLQAPFSSAVDVAKAFLPIFPIRKLMIDQFRSDLLIQDIRTPLLIQHGRSDWVVPFRFGKRLYARAPEPKRFIGYVGGGHNDLPEKHDSYRDLKRFVLDCFDMSMGASTAIRASPAAHAPRAAKRPSA